MTTVHLTRADVLRALRAQMDRKELNSFEQRKLLAGQAEFDRTHDWQADPAREKPFMAHAA